MTTPTLSAKALLLASVCFGLPGVALAQDTILLEEIIVSGGLTAIAEDGYGRAATVLDATEIADRGITSVQDALRALPGVSVSSTGNSLTSVRIRGGEADHVLILIDGVEAAGGADEYTLSGLETAGIERIEVLRGPQSAFFGSNASSGVINIITDKGAEGLHFGTALEAGNGIAVSAYVSNRTDRGGLRFSLSQRDDAGFDQSGDGGEKDGINRRTATLSGDWKATDALTLGFNLRRAAERYEFDGAAFYDSIQNKVVDNSGTEVTGPDGYIFDDPTLFSNRDETTGALWAEFSAMGGQMVHRLEMQDSLFKQGYLGGAPTRGHTEKLKYRASVGLDGVVGEARHQLNFLLEDQKDSSSAAAGNPREMSSVALEYRGFWGSGFDIQAGIRRDDNKVFADFTGWNLGLSYRFVDTGLRVHASAGRAQVNPSYFALFSDVVYDFNGFKSHYAGNPNLRPEINSGYDLGIEAEVLGGRGLIDVTYFNEALEDEIEDYYVGFVGGQSEYTFRNQTGKSKRQGVEVAGHFQASDDVMLGMTYTYLDAKNPDGSVEVRRPRHELGLSATMAAFSGRGSVTADMRHVAGNWDDQFWGAYARAELPESTTVNLVARYDLNETVVLTGRISNVFDAETMEVWGYEGAGRTVWAGLEAKW